MIIDLNALHPVPRYGAALIAMEHGEECFSDLDQFLKTAIAVIEEQMEHLMLGPNEVPGEDAVMRYRPHRGAKPGKMHGHISANGFFLLPHFPTSDKLAEGTVSAIYKIMSGVSSATSKTIALSKGFAPHTSKINAGKASMQPPKVSVEEGVLTILAACHALKFAGYQKTPSSKRNYFNTIIIPDLPYPVLKGYLRISRKLLSLPPKSYIGRFEDNKYKRPPAIFNNFRHAPTNVNLGALGLLAAVGLYTKEATDLDEAEARPVLVAMAERPIYLFANGGSSQQSYSHHLVDLALSGALHAASTAINRVELIAIESNKFGDPKWDLFKLATARFFTLFRPAYARDFFAVRAIYPRAFRPVFLTYFQQVMRIPDDIVTAAEAYGRRLNTAAYIGATDEIKDDNRRGRTGPKLREYKNRILTQFESSIGSAKSGPELISRLSTIVGRASGLDFPDDARPFMVAAVAGAVDVDTAKQLAMAFMRLQSPQQARDTAEDVSETPESAGPADEHSNSDQDDSLGLE